MAQVERIARIRMACNEAYADRPADYILRHGQRVARIALDLADRSERSGEVKSVVDREVLYTGALFHDVGRAKLDDGQARYDGSDVLQDPDNVQGTQAHEVVGSERTVELLAHLFTSDELNRIRNIVLHHNHREPPNDHPAATKLVQDADSLDHVGLVGAWLVTYHVACEGGNLEDVLRCAHSATRIQDREKMRRELNFEVARRLFDARVAREEAHYRALARLEGMGDSS
jgi:HD superfamily phosphodiesterase